MGGPDAFPLHMRARARARARIFKAMCGSAPYAPLSPRPAQWGREASKRRPMQTQWEAARRENPNLRHAEMKKNSVKALKALAVPPGLGAL